MNKEQHEATAVTYQRVSTKDQASKGGHDEGFSIPAQKQSNAKKPRPLGLESWQNSLMLESQHVPLTDLTCNACSNM